MAEEQEQVSHKNGVSVVESGHGRDKSGRDKPDKPDKSEKSDKAEHKPKLRSQASVGRDIDLIKQPSGVSDT